MAEDSANSGRWSARTEWSPRIATPMRRFLRTETGSAAILLGATLAALVWVNVDRASYEAVWDAQLSIRLGSWTIGQDLREWVNSGLMTFFFFVVGLEARREFDLGDLRERQRLAIPFAAGVLGMVVPVGIYLAVNAGRSSAHGWGTTMATDTAFALGMLTLVAPKFGDRLRVFMLTVAVVDDLVSLLVIAAGYSEHVRMMPLLLAFLGLGAVLGLRALGLRPGLVVAILGVFAWVGAFRSGVDPVVVGLALGLMTYAYPAARNDLERASDLFRLFREQPTPELARTASIGLNSAISPNERLQQLYHPWSSYLIVPVFALANAGIGINGSFLARAFTSPVTLGIIAGYLVGKPIGIVGATALLTRLSGGRLRAPVGWAGVTGAGAVAGIGFTVSLLIASLAFEGEQLQEAKLGVLTAALCASLLSWLVFRITSKLSPQRKVLALLGTSESIVDLAVPVDLERDHTRGGTDALVTMVEYGDFECPNCGEAEPAVRALLADYGSDVRYVWRHLPLTDVHPSAQLAAQATECADLQGKFWEMHDLLLAHQDELTVRHLLRYAKDLGMEVARFRDDLRAGTGTERIAEDVESADLSGVSGTPTFFVNGLRHQGAYDIASLKMAVKLAQVRAGIGTVPAAEPVTG